TDGEKRFSRRWTFPPLSKMRSYAWRLTGFYLWIKLLVIWFSGADTVQAWEAAFFHSFTSLISELGFAPSNPAVLPIVLKIGWVFVITRFQLLRVFLLVLYLTVFPAVLLFFLFSKIAKPKVSDPPIRPSDVEDIDTKYLEEEPAFPLLTAAVLVLLGWFVLFGGGSQAKLVLPAVILTALIFASLLNKAFDRVRPPRDRVFFGKVLMWARLQFRFFQIRRQLEPCRNIKEIDVNQLMLRPFRWVGKKSLRALH